MPKFQDVATEEKGFLAEEERISKGRVGATFEEAELAKTKAGDVYGLGMSAVGRAEKTAGMTKEAGLGQLQGQAGKLGAQMRGAYEGGMGGGMRGAIGGQAAMAKGVGRTYDQYGLQMGAAADEATRLGQEKGYAATRFGIAEDRRDLGISTAELAKERGMYGLEKAATTAFETDVFDAIDPSWVNPGEDFTGAEQTTYGQWWREGGKVPDKSESFSHFLTKLPDAGGM